MYCKCIFWNCRSLPELHFPPTVKCIMWEWHVWNGHGSPSSIYQKSLFPCCLLLVTM